MIGKLVIGFTFNACVYARLYGDAPQSCTRYHTFIVHSESAGYQLEIGQFSGTVVDDRMSVNNRATFASKDRGSSSSCATYHGGFWYGVSCGWAFVNAWIPNGWFTWVYLTPGGGSNLLTTRIWLVPIGKWKNQRSRAVCAIMVRAVVISTAGRSFDCTSSDYDNMQTCSRLTARQ